MIDNISYILIAKEWYCGIIIICGGPMFVAFVGTPWTEINFPTNLCTCICLIFIFEIELGTSEITSPEPENIFYPQSLTPTNKNDSKVYHFPGGGQRYVTLSDGLKLGLTTGQAHEVHQFVFFGQTKEGGVAKLTHFPDQQLVGLIAVLLVANAKDLRCHLLKLPKTSQASIANSGRGFLVIKHTSYKK